MCCRLPGCDKHESSASSYCSEHHRRLAKAIASGQPIPCQAPRCSEQAFRGGLYCSITHRDQNTPTNGQLGCKFPGCRRFAFTNSTYCSRTHRDVALGRLSPRDLWPIATPLKLENWKILLKKHGILDEFKDVVDGIENGFTLKSKMRLSKSQVARHHPSAYNNSEHVNDKVKEDLEEGRYYGPYTKLETEALLGRSFISHPLSAIPKSDPNKYRIVENLSWRYDPDVPSLNELSDHSDVPTEWGGMEEMIELVITAKEGAQGATLDWEDAFRQLPIRRDELWMGVVQWNLRKGGPDEFYVDGNAKFGHSRSIGTFGRVNKAFTTILQKEGLGDVIYWVDDLCIRRDPLSGHKFRLQHILEVADFLGVPLPKEKISPFSNITQYIGFDWYWDSKKVEIPDEKKSEALEEVRNIASKRSVSKTDLGALCGLFAHLAQVVDEGKAQMRALYEMHTQMRGEARWSPAALEELKWWKAQLKKSHFGMRLCTQRIPDDSYGVYVDASPSWGIGVVIGGQYDRFKLLNGWEATRDGGTRDFGWAEFVAVELAVLFLINKYSVRDRHILIHSDSQGVIGEWEARYSRNSERNAVLIRIIRMLNQAECFMSLQYVPSDDNIADAASRGGSPDGLTRCSFSPLPKDLGKLLIRK